MSFYQILRSFLLLDHLPFANLLSEAELQAIVEEGQATSSGPGCQPGSRAGANRR